MSSPKAQTVKAARPARTASGGAPDSASTLSADAMRLATTIERDLSAGRLDALTPQALQALMTAGCKAYAAQVEAGRDLLPFGQRNGVSPTDVMVTASGLLRAVNLAVFELGMWQSWTGR
jgi:hypothetical protein